MAAVFKHDISCSKIMIFFALCHTVWCCVRHLNFKSAYILCSAMWPIGDILEQINDLHEGDLWMI